MTTARSRVLAMHRRAFHRAPRWSWLLTGLALLLLVQQYVVGLPATATSPLVPLARLGDLVLLVGVLVLAHAAGMRLLRALRLVMTPVERAAFATALGLGSGGYLLLALGWLGLYRAPVLLAGLALSALLVRHDVVATCTALRAFINSAAQDVRRRALTPGAVAATVLLVVSLALALLGALTPPHHYDPLAYHLYVPQQYLRTGRIPWRGLEGVEFSNLPFTAELLYGVGLAFGSAVFGQLLHYAFGGLTAAALWAVARQRFDAPLAWLALATFLGTPLVVVWARVADVDLALACFLFLALTAALRADDAAAGIDQRWLVLSGSFMGLALGTKYQALFAAAPLLVLILAERWRRRGARLASLDAAHFTVATLLVAAPWYVKNWIVFGNPVWPTLSGAALSPLRFESINYFARGMIISPRTPLGYLALPLRAYTYGDIEQRLVILSPLYLLLPALVFLPRRREVTYCLVVSLCLGLGWALGFQELRYLLPVCAPLSLAMAYLLRAAWRHQLWRRLVMPALAFSALLTLLLVFLHVGADRPFAVLLGRESRDAYLRQSVTAGASYRATSFLGTQVRPGDTVYFFSEAQLYYVPFAARPDQLDLALIELTTAYAEPANALAALHAAQVDYLLVNEANLRYRQGFDPDGRLARAIATFARLTPLLEVVYRDGPVGQPRVTIYRVPPATGATPGR